MALETYPHTLDGFISEPSLPPEVLAVLPSESLLQLELAYKITCHAYAQQVSRLEGEAQEMQAKLGQNQQHIKSLERRLTSMEADMQEHQQRARQSVAEQHKLAAEKNALIETVKRLNRELAKLEHFKKNLLQQLQDEEQSGATGGFAPSLAAIDLTTERLVSEVLQSADGIAAAAAITGGVSGQPSYSQQVQQQEGRQQQQTAVRAAGSRLSPPKAGALGGAGINRTLGSPLGNKPYTSATGAGPNSIKAGSSAAATGSSPYSRAGGAGVRSPSATGSAAAGQLSAGNRFASPPVGRGADQLPSAAAGRAAAAGAGSSVAMSSSRIDGKEFFRQARARLSYEQFSQFLVAIKDLNAGRATREETLAAARQLFGTANSELYGLFEGLLVRHLTAL